MRPAHTPRPTPKFILILLAVAAVAGMIYYFFFMSPSGGGPGGPGGFAMPVDAARISTDSLEVTVDAVGTLRSNESVVLRPEVAGRVEAIYFEEGSKVRADDVLIQLDDRLARAELQQAEAQLKLASTEQARAVKLKRKGAVSQSRLDQANADLGVAEANTNLARARLDKTRIYAPFDGAVGLRRISPGDYVNVGQELANFESFDPMKVEFNVPEVYAPLLREGQTVDLTIDALPGKKFAGSVYALDPRIDTSGRNIMLRATVPNPDNELKPGYFARVTLKVENKTNALMVPEAAIVPRGSETYIYVLGEENKVTLSPVRLGIRRDGKVEVLTGVKAGDVVVTAGQMKIQPGMAVMPQIAGEEKGTPGAAPSK